MAGPMGGDESAIVQVRIIDSNRAVPDSHLSQGSGIPASGKATPSSLVIFKRSEGFFLKRDEPQPGHLPIIRTAATLNSDPVGFQRMNKKRRLPFGTQMICLVCGGAQRPGKTALVVGLCLFVYQKLSQGAHPRRTHVGSAIRERTVRARRGRAFMGEVSVGTADNRY